MATLSHSITVQSDGSLAIDAILPGHTYRIRTDTEVNDWAGVSWLDGQYYYRQSRTAQKEWHDAHKMSGGVYMLQAPQTCRVQLENGNSQFKLPDRWIDELTRRNPTTIKYISRGGSGIVNKNTYPTFQALLFRDNKVQVDSVDGHKVWLRHFDLNKPPFEDAELWHAFTVIDQFGKTLLPDPPGAVCWLPVIAPCRMWIEVKELEHHA